MTLITLGPLTNVAVGLKVNPFHGTEVPCGGGDGGDRGAGNVSRWLSSICRSHAAHRVFRASLPLMLVPLDVTTRVGVTRADLGDVVTASPHPIGRLVADMTSRRSISQSKSKVTGSSISMTLLRSCRSLMPRS